ncbi:hypothetical protein [Streptomyces sp. NPDC058466]|uniref:hypothetical protein n=1 Tax=Streptomyces sp. NPDC058466 TaxID=3346512 RepID=UPI003658DCFC
MRSSRTTWCGPTAASSTGAGLTDRRTSTAIEIIQNLRERIREARANGRLGEVEGLQGSFDAAMAKLSSLKRSPTDGRPQLVDLGMPVFTDHAPSPRQGPGGPR